MKKEEEGKEEKEKKNEEEDVDPFKENKELVVVTSGIRPTEVGGEDLVVCPVVADELSVVAPTAELVNIALQVTKCQSTFGAQSPRCTWRPIQVWGSACSGKGSESAGDGHRQLLEGFSQKPIFTFFLPFPWPSFPSN